MDDIIGIDMAVKDLSRTIATHDGILKKADVPDSNHVVYPAKELKKMVGKTIPFKMDAASDKIDGQSTLYYDEKLGALCGKTEILDQDAIKKMQALDLTHLTISAIAEGKDVEEIDGVRHIKKFKIKDVSPIHLMNNIKKND